MNVLEISNVTKLFDKNLAVDNLSLTVKEGAIFGFLGPNGAGKTTTIRMLMDIYAPDSGTIRVFGEAPGEKMRKRIGYLPEERGLYQDMKVLDQLRFFRELYGLPEKEGEKRILEWLDRLDLQSHSKKAISALSKGTQQKIQFIIAVLHDPDLLILDEPFSGLDPISVDALKRTIGDLRRRGKTVIFSTHQMEQVEQLCDEISLINNGRQLLLGTLNDIKRASSKRLVRITFQGGNGFLDKVVPGRFSRFPGYYEIRLQNESETQSILSKAIVAGVQVSRFEVVEDSLNDIFIETVKAAQHA